MENRWQYEARDSGESRGELEGLIDEEEEEDWEIARHYHIQVLTKTFARGDNLLGVSELLAWRLARRHRMRKPPPLKR